MPFPEYRQSKSESISQAGGSGAHNGHAAHTRSLAERDCVKLCVKELRNAGWDSGFRVIEPYVRLAQTFETKRGFWLRGLDLNQRPLGYESFNIRIINELESVVGSFKER